MANKQYTKDSIWDRAKKLGIIGKGIWTEEEIIILTNNYNQSYGKQLQNLLPRHSIDAITKKANELHLSSNYNKSWSNEENNIIKEFFIKEQENIVNRFTCRSWESVQNQARKLGIYKKNYWTKEEDQILIQYYGTNIKKCTELLSNRSLDSIRVRASKLGLKRNKKPCQYSMQTGDFIQEFDNCIAAAIAIGEPVSSRKLISGACTGAKNSAYGYYWSYIKANNYKEIKYE